MRHRTTKKRPRNLATRFRLVGQVLGSTKAVQKVVETVKAIQQIQSTETQTDAAPVQKLLKDTILVTAWETTPVDDLKILPWDEMLRTAVEHLETYRAWKAADN